MSKPVVVALIAALAVPVALSPDTARADRGGAVAAGVAGGLIGGLVIGSAIARPRYYEPAPVYAAPPPPPTYTSCYWTRGEPVWDSYRGVWVRPRMKVCD